MALSLAGLEKGHGFPAVTFDLSREWVREYVSAVGDEAIATIGTDVVPPMAVAALSVRALLEHASLPPGTIHAGQELLFLRAVRVGESLTVAARIVSRGERAGWVLMSVELRVEAVGAAVMDGRATVTFPAMEAAA